MNAELAQLLERRYRTLRRSALISGGVALAVMIAGILWGVASMVAGPNCPKNRLHPAAHAACVERFTNDVVTRTAVIGVLAGVILIIALVAFWPVRRLAEAPLLRVFTSRRSEVVWIYPKRTSVRRYGAEVRAIHAVVVGLLDRKRLSL